MDNRIFRILLQVLPLLIPLNIYVIGDFLGAGLQWALVRYQQSYLGTSIIPVTRDIYYVTSGSVTGSSAVSLVIWSAGTLILVAALLLVVFIVSLPDTDRYYRYPPLLTIFAGFLFLSSCMLQYGFSLYGTGGFTIPLGVPVIWIIGYRAYHSNRADEQADPGEIPPDGA